MAKPANPENIRPLRVLHLEDEPDFCRLVEDLLARDGLPCELVMVSDLAGFIAALEQSRFDIILADYNLPQFGAVPALRRVQELELDVPFIIVSGSIGEEAAVAAIHRLALAPQESS